MGNCGRKLHSSIHPFSHTSVSRSAVDSPSASLIIPQFTPVTWNTSASLVPAATMAANNMHNLTTLIKRLEAATSRLEDMASSSIEIPAINGAPTPAPTGPLPAPPVAKAPSPKPVQEALPESVEDFDAFIAGTVKKYVNLSDELGGPVAEQVGRIANSTRSWD